VEFSIFQGVVLAVEYRRIVHLLAHAVVEFSISPVAVLAVEHKLIIHLSIVVAMDEFAK
jgi:hypothetical protein